MRWVVIYVVFCFLWFDFFFPFWFKNLSQFHLDAAIFDSILSCLPSIVTLLSVKISIVWLFSEFVLKSCLRLSCVSYNVSFVSNCLDVYFDVGLGFYDLFLWFVVSFLYKVEEEWGISLWFLSVISLLQIVMHISLISINLSVKV